MKVLAASIWLLMLIVGYTYTSKQSRALAKQRYELLTKPPLADLDTRLLDIFMLGHRGLYDDFMAVWSIQFLADPKLKREASAQDVFDTLMAIGRHHPRLESFYMAGCFVLAFDFQRPGLCEPLTQYGMAALPDAWRIPSIQGFIFAYRMKDWKSAAAYYAIAASRPQAPALMHQVSTNLLTKGRVSREELDASFNRLFEVPGGSRFQTFIDDVVRAKLRYQRQGGNEGNP